MIWEKWIAARRVYFRRSKTGSPNHKPFCAWEELAGSRRAAPPAINCTCTRAGDLKYPAAIFAPRSSPKMPAGRKGKAKSTAVSLPVDIEEEDEKEFSCGEEADSPRGKSVHVHINILSIYLFLLSFNMCF